MLNFVWVKKEKLVLNFPSMEYVKTQYDSKKL